MVQFNFLSLFLTFSAFFIPGLLASFALLFKSSFSKFEKILFAILFACVLPPFLGILEKLMGFKFFASSVFFNLALISVASIVALAYLYRDKLMGLKDAKIAIPEIKFSEASFNKFLLKNWSPILLIILLIVTFWIRFSTSFSPAFFEFDPYFYDHVTEHLVKDGFIPPSTDEVYYPNPKALTVPMFLAFMAGGWNLVYNAIAGVAFDKEILIAFSQLYPPIVSILMVTFLFFLVREVFKNDVLALSSAALLSFMPQIITKTAAGVTELQPLGLALPVILFSVYSIAMFRKNVVLSILVGFLAFISAIGTNTNLWSFAVFGVFIFMQAFLDFLLKQVTKEKAILNASLGLGALLGHLGYFAFWQQDFALVTSSLLMILATITYLAIFAIDYFASKLVWLGKISRNQLFAAVVFVFLLISILTPLGSKISDLVSAETAFSFAGGPIEKTVQESGATGDGFFESSFGVFGWVKKDAQGNAITYQDDYGVSHIAFYLSPYIILMLAALVLALLAAGLLFENGYVLASIVFGTVSAVFTVFNGVFDYLFSGSIKSIFADQPNLISFFTNDVFIYTCIAVSAALLIYLLSKEKNPILLLLVIAVFPVSFIGLNKLKFMVFLAVALCLAFPLFVGQFIALLEWLNLRFKLASAKTFGIAMLIAVLIFSLPIVGYQMGTVKSSMDQLKNTRISQDWIDTLAWMKGNLTNSDRVISWWDYGHWTVFFAEKKSVLDPGNNYADMDSEVAHAFVAGTREELIATMKRHQATVILLDAELIPKWGALNYLQSTWNTSLNNYSPCNTEWQKGPGGSKCEVEHSYELLNIGQQCAGSLIPMIELQSNVGLKWCVPVKNGQIGDKMYLETRDGVSMDNPRSVSVFSDAVKNGNPAEFANTSILIPYQQNVLLNINPDFSVVGIQNRYFQSNYAQLFFFEKLAGFEKIYSSPNGQVKLFRLVQ